jgi:hypothetical protein
MLLLCFLGTAHGVIINVPGDSTTIQSAINGASPGDTVLVGEEHYYERLNFLGKDIFLTSMYLYTGDTLTIQNTIIDADTGVLGPADTACAIILCGNETENAVVQGFTIQNGAGYKNEFDRRLGGGIMCIGASPTIAHNIFRQNSAVHCGGALCGIDTSHARVTYNIFTDNRSGSGGALMFSESFPTITHNQIVNNYVDTTGYPVLMTMGGGIYTYKCASVIAHNYIAQNTAAIGGGICSYVLDTDSIAENEIVFNSAVGDSGFGGGISCFHTFSGSITGNTICDNTASAGGGIHLYLSNAIPGEDALITGNVMLRNTAVSSGTGRGGGALNFLQFSKGLVSGNLFAENTAPAAGGGGIAFWQSLVPVDANTFVHNSALAGGAMYAYASGAGAVVIEVVNTICWADTGLSAGKEFQSVGLASFNVRYSDVDSGHAGVGNIDCDPMFCYPDTHNYYLHQASCCAGTGEGGVNIGAFGVGCDSTLVSEVVEGAPARFLLCQNRPNPFKLTTTISYVLEERSTVELIVLDVLGRRLEILKSGTEAAGLHEADWDAEGVPGGVYFFTMHVNDRSQTKKMLLLR